MSATPEYVLVPRVPTEEMIDAACESEARAVVIARNRAKWPKLNDQCSHGEIFVVEYQAALAAAPAHPPAALPDGWLQEAMALAESYGAAMAASVLDRLCGRITEPDPLRLAALEDHLKRAVP